AAAPAPAANGQPPAPIIPFSQRLWSITSRDAIPFKFDVYTAKDGTITIVIRGGINITSTDLKNGTIDITADNAVIWTRRSEKTGAAPGAGVNTQGQDEPLEVYLEGHVIFRQDKRQVAGTGDWKIFKANRLYFDYRNERSISLDAEVNFYAPGLVAPIRTTGPEINQFHEPVGTDPKGRPLYRMLIRVDRPVTTGSRFPQPGYLFRSRSLDLTQVVDAQQEPSSGTTVGSARDPKAPKEKVWLIDARQNFFFIGPVPVFYWPRVLTESDDLDPPLRQFSYRYGNYFGHQFLFDFNGFKLLNLRKPQWIDNWNVDVDELTLRGIAFGSEIGFFGKDLIGDLTDPYRKNQVPNEVDYPYFGYFDIWGLPHDSGVDVLGPGPAIVTNGPPGAGKRGYQRLSVPPFANPRGRISFRFMQSLLGPEALDDEDLRYQIEFGYISDRHFLEEYYKRLFDTGLDQETLFYGIRQKENRAFTIQAETVLQNWYTDTQWLPKLEYYRIGDSLLGNWFSYSQDSGFDWANTHTAVEVNNPNIFAFMPYDPVSNTFGPLRTARAWTSHELDLPLNLEVIRIVPYLQGQLVDWNNQLGGQMIGRAWGAAGARANVMLWRNFPNVDSELLNLHGLSHKINFDANYRTAYSNVNLNRIGVQDDLDDNTYEFTRRYFALTNYIGGILPMQYDPRFLTLRRAISPIGGTTDIQATIQTLQLGIHQRLQTKRGPEGRRRVIDYMILDFDTTYFPNADRDNFGKPFGQTFYNYEWFLGDRTSIVSTGWFEFWRVNGNPILLSNPRHSNDPFGLNIIMTGVSINRPPRGNVFISYSIVNTGPIATSALTSAFSYWLSPKWFGTFATTYDFGNAILLGSTFSITRIGADFLTSVGLTVDPQRQNYTFGLEIVPRFSPNVRLGSAAAAGRFDSRFAPVP
ncbi:MAG: hypothetical protein IRY99_19295, partial [Isosphaeraceae bacterium]|nr:hypothetical protein [Isosphaeraceae bacterium]